ncbi:MAG TPA: acyltransferase [Gemmatimonadaceae bacterium]|nr:acyltransferase [Gemmatimonadaceae bacterium]
MTSSVSPGVVEPGASSDGLGLHGTVPELPPQVGRSFPEPDIWLRLRQVRQRPGHALDTLLALARGQYYKLKFRLLGRRFRAGKHFRVYNRLFVEGPGEVVLGDYVLCERNVSLFTHSPRARLIIGHKVNMGGTQFGCVREINIRDNTVLADANIMDSDFHSIFPNRRSPEAPVRVKPVDIGPNAWICGRVAVLAGTRVGENSVVGYGAVCARSYPANSIIVGNPAKVVGSIPADPSERTSKNPDEWITQHDMAR